MTIELLKDDSYLLECYGNLLNVLYPIENDYALGDDSKLLELRTFRDSFVAEYNGNPEYALENFRWYIKGRNACYYNLYEETNKFKKAYFKDKKK